MTNRRKPTVSFTLAYLTRANSQRFFSFSWLRRALVCCAPSQILEGHCTNKSKFTDASNNDILHNMNVIFNPVKSSVWFSHW